MTETPKARSAPDALNAEEQPKKKQWYKKQEVAQPGQTRPLADALNAISYDPQGLVPVIAQCVSTQQVLMMAWMNEDALKETIETSRMCYWSRSRQKLWRKGESSGHQQKLVSLRIDCDGDTLLAKVEQTGPACHTNRQNCFFWEVEPKTQTICLQEDSPK